MVMESSKPPLLVRARKYARLLQEGEEAHSIIRIQNLSTEALVGGAIWGVPSDDGHRNVLQPVLISCTLSLREHFKSAARSDSVNSSTVNYSTLSKEILKVIASRRPNLPHSEDFQGLRKDWSIYDLVEWMQLWLTGYSSSGNRPSVSSALYFLDGACPCLVDKSDPSYKTALLDTESLSELGFTLFLPKATLLSSGVSLTTSSIYFPAKAYQSTLKIHGIRIPTLIGVNTKERLARQIVIASVEIDPYICQKRDYYNELEQLIFKTTEESSFETLESLATQLCARIIKHFIYIYTPYFRYPELLSSPSPHPHHHLLPKTPFSTVRVTLEKPSAVTFAAAPAVEVLRSADPREDGDAERLWAEHLERAADEDLPEPEIPYPLQGTLAAWLEEEEEGGD